MKWKYLVGASILTAGLLVKVGAPLVPIALGIALAVALNWRKRRANGKA